VESVTSFNATLTDWLARFGAGRRAVLTRGAQRFASLVAAVSELEVPREAGQGPLAAKLCITSGLHRGASMQLTCADYLIGSGNDCHIVLRDAEVAARHCRLTREWSGFTVRDVRPTVPQTILASRVSYEAGAIEAQYDVGGVQFVLRHPPPPGAQRPGQLHMQPASWVYLVVIVGVMVGVLTLSVAGRAAKKVSPRADAQHNVLVASDLVEEARRALADNTVRVVSQDGRLRIEGRTTQKALRTRIRALAEDLRGTVAVEDRVVYVDADDLNSSPGPLPVSVQSVMIGNPSYFLTDSGARYFVGGVLPDGAEVLSIDAGAIQFLRGGRVIAYPLQ
jgi:hypothetical protein